MSLSAIGSISSATSQPQIHEAVSSSQQSSASLQPDTVTLSPAAQKASQGGDVDHDGDSH